VWRTGDVEKVILKREAAQSNPQYFVHMKKVYDIIKRSHNAIGHGGHAKMLKELTSKYANITRDVVELFKSLCSECIKKLKRMQLKVSL
jgi:hypothetical protein